MRNFLLILFICLGFSGISQNRYLVVFTDKIETNFDVVSYFDTAALKSFKMQGLPAYDWYDLPVNSSYIEALSPFVDSLRFDLRWFNGVVVYGTADQMNVIKEFSFIKEIITLGNSGAILSNKKEKDFDADLKNDFKVFDWQLETMGGSYFKKRNIDGTGIRVCVLDVGFPDVDTDPITKHLFNNGNYIEGYDFIRDKPLRFKGFKHGKQVLSFIAGKIDTHRVGLATNIELLLARTEWMLTEKPYEEEVWVKALEWAHKKGARLVNSSLGYSGKSHSHEELDGKTTLTSRAGNLAAKKGMLVINSAGNEGIDEWKRIAFPADADSVLAVGGISEYDGIKLDFSSFGPSKDLRIKPNVCALGRVYILNKNEFEIIDGTSFSAPLITGFAACVLQLNPTLKPFDLLDTLQKIGSLYPYYDYSHGFGVPQASKLFNDVIFNDTSSVVLLKSPNYLQNGYYFLKFTKPEYFETQVFYHIQSRKGYLKGYYVVTFNGDASSQPRIYEKDLEVGDVIRVWHRGTYFEKVIK